MNMQLFHKAMKRLSAVTILAVFVGLAGFAGAANNNKPSAPAKSAPAPKPAARACRGLERSRSWTRNRRSEPWTYHWRGRYARADDRRHGQPWTNRQWHRRAHHYDHWRAHDHHHRLPYHDHHGRCRAHYDHNDHDPYHNDHRRAHGDRRRSASWCCRRSGCASNWRSGCWRCARHCRRRKPHGLQEPRAQGEPTNTSPRAAARFAPAPTAG